MKKIFNWFLATFFDEIENGFNTKKEQDKFYERIKKARQGEKV